MADDFTQHMMERGVNIFTIPTFTRTNGRSKAFGMGGNKHATPLNARRSTLILPGLSSFNPIALSFQGALSEQLNAELTPDVDEEGFTTTGVYGSFDSIRSVSGYEQTPMSPVMVNNAVIRKELGLSLNYSEVERAIANEFWELAFSSYKVKPLKVPKKSTWGAIRFTTDHTLKRAYADWLLQPDIFEQMLATHHSGDLVALANEYEMLLMFYLQKRTQVDPPSKVRKFFDYDYAVSGGERGATGNTDKSVVIEGRRYDDFSAMRVRTVQAGPWPVNVVNSVIATGTLHALFERFPNTFHINTPEEIEKAVNGHNVYASDVSQYDASMSEEAIDVFFDCATKYWDERMVKISRDHMFSCYYARPLDLHSTRGKWVGDPMSSELKVCGGNRSGHGATSLVAKGNKIIDELIVFHKIGIPVLGNIESILKGESVLKLINNGDDNLILGNGPIFDKYVAARSDPKAGHYLVEREVGCVYSGNVIMKTDSQFVYSVAPRVTTSFEKMYVPERSIGGVMRPFWHIGWLQRINEVPKTDAIGRAWDIHHRVYRDILEPHIGSLVGILADASRRAEFRFDDLTYAEREVLEDPDKLHYKFLESDVRDEIVSTAFGAVPVSVVEPIINTYYKGSLL